MAIETLPAVEPDENPRLPRYAAAPPAALLAEAVSRAGVEFRTVSPATVVVNLAFLAAGGQPGAFSPAVAGSGASDYLGRLRTDAGATPIALAEAYLRYLRSNGLAGVAAQQRAIVDVYQQVLAAGGRLGDAAAGTAYTDYLRARAAGREPAIGAAAIAAYDAYARRLGFGSALDAGRRAQLDAFAALRSAGLTPSSQSLATLVGAYLDHLQAGRDPAAFAATNPQGIATALAYLAAFGLPGSLDPALSARIAAFTTYVAAGGPVTSLPPAPTPTPTPTPVPEPTLTTATWMGSLGGDAGTIEIGADAAGAPIRFGPNRCVGTARLLEVVRGSGCRALRRRHGHPDPQRNRDGHQLRPQ